MTEDRIYGVTKTVISSSKPVTPKILYDVWATKVDGIDTIGGLTLGQLEELDRFLRTFINAENDAMQRIVHLCPAQSPVQ